MVITQLRSMPTWLLSYFLLLSLGVRNCYILNHQWTSILPTYTSIVLAHSLFNNSYSLMDCLLIVSMSYCTATTVLFSSLLVSICNTNQN